MIRSSAGVPSVTFSHLSSPGFTAERSRSIVHPLPPLPNYCSHLLSRTYQLSLAPSKGESSSLSLSSSSFSSDRGDIKMARLAADLVLGECCFGRAQLFSASSSLRRRVCGCSRLLRVRFHLSVTPEPVSCSVCVSERRLSVRQSPARLRGHRQQRVQGEFPVHPPLLECTMSLLCGNSESEDR